MQKGQTEILIGLIAVILITASAATELFKPANETATENQNTYLKDLTDEQKEVQEKIEKENEKNAISDYALNEVSIPQNVQAVPGPTVGQITITWNKVLDADYYNVSWRTGNNVGAFHHIPLNIMTDSFNFEEKKYYYQVKACNQSDECSEYSEWVSAYPQIGVEINAPSVAETNNWILISAEVELTDYPEFQWSFNGNSSCFSQGLNQEELRIKCTEKGNVFVSVTVNSQEKNIAEDSVSIKIIEDEINIVPDTPEIVGARPGSNPGEIKVEWNRVDGADSYEVKWEVPSTVFGNTIQVDSQSDSVIYKTTFPANQSLQYHSHEIRACNAFGCSEYSTEFLALPKLGVEINAPILIEKNTQTTVNAKLSYFDFSSPSYFEWNLIENSANCFLDDSYIISPEIQCSSVGFVKLEVFATANNFDSAVNEKTIEVNDSISSVPPVPENIKAEKGINSGEIKVSWNSSPATEYYEVKYRAPGFVSGKTFDSSLNSFEFKTDVPSNVNQPMHYVSVRACNAFGCSNFSSEKQVYPKMNSVILSPKTAEKDETFNLEALVEYPAGIIQYNWETTNHDAQCTINNISSQTTTAGCSTKGWNEIKLKIHNSEYEFFDSAESTKLIEINESVFDLQPPQYIQAVPGDNPEEIKLTWIAVEGAEGYAIEWESEHLNPNWNQPYHGVTGSSSNSFVFVWPKPEEETGKFYFRLRAFNGSQSSDYSERVWSYLK